MLCEKCKKNTATTIFRQNINGVQTEMHLCDECSAQLSGQFESEYTKMFSDFGFGVGSMLGSIFGQEFLPESLAVDKTPKCSMCGTSLSKIRKTGNVGCSKCYETFREQLMPLIQRIHGKTTHSGRVPASAEEKLSVKNKIVELEKMLKKAIDEQEFEKAAELRDELKSLRESEN